MAEPSTSRLVSAGKGERTAPPLAALQVAQRFLEQGGFTYTCQHVGDKIVTVDCALKHSDGRAIHGRGKGLGRQAEASAIFEAIEHFFYEYEPAPAEPDPNLFSPYDPQHADIYSRGGPDFRLLTTKTSLPLTCNMFTEICGERTLRYPAILSNPKFVPRSPSEAEFIVESGVFRYSSNTGTASGITVDDAALHGALEIVERDALGLALLRSTVKRRADPLSRLSSASIPAQLRELIRAAETEVGGQVTLWDITTDVGVPTYLSRMTKDAQSFFGSGASLVASYAVERAVLEAVQVYHIQEHFGPRLQTNFRDCDRMSLFQRCGLTGGVFYYRGGEREFEFQPRSDEGWRSSREQLAMVVNLVRGAGLELFQRTIASGPVHVVQLVAPGMERSHLLSHGLAVVPARRGKEALMES